MPNTRDIRCRVELYDTTTITHTPMKQGDTTRLILEVYRDGEAYDLTGLSITVNILRPDGTAFIQSDGYSVASNVVDALLDHTATAVPGRASFEVMLIDTAANAVLSSFVFSQSIEPRLINDENVVDGELDRITEIVLTSTRAPYIGPDGAWWQWDNDKQAFVSTGVAAGGGGGGGGGYIIGSGLKLDVSTGTLSVDTTDTPAETDARPITSQGVYNEFAVINALLKTI